MKNIRNISKLVLALALTLAMVASASAQQMVKSTAKVVRIKGDARYANSDQIWKPLKVGDTLYAGAVIQTAKDSRVDLILGEKNAVASEYKWGEVVKYQPEVEQDFVRVWESSVLVLEKLLIAETGTDKVRETGLDLRAGKIFGTVKKLTGASKYEVKVPNGVAGIRGTIYIISAEGILSVLRGAVVIAYADGTGAIVTQTVVAGQSFDLRTGQFAPIPEYLLREGRDAENDCNGSQPGHGHHNPNPHQHTSPTTGRPRSNDPPPGPRDDTGPP